MVSFRTAVLALASAAAVAADYYIVPSSVDLGTRKSWCADEISTCPIICNQVPPGGYKVNTCDPETLTYGCTCANGLQPNISEYSVTLPFHVCQEWGNQCAKSCGSDSECVRSCREDHPCGAQNPTRVNTTTSSTMSATSTATNQIFTGLGGSGSTSSSDSKNAAPALQLGSAYGLAVIAGSVLAGIFMML